ncbi:MAG TPA: MXAN_2562 family outer membrane beta-barrel protein [Polyangia bacterium]|nr:MXAN_2562 family outer membrane beta-barrel protein [Polyangia bacterium]
MSNSLAFSRRWHRVARVIKTTSGATLLVLSTMAATAARAQTTTLGASDFTLTLSRIDSSGNFTALDDTARAAFFSKARCACGTNFGVTLALTSAGAGKLTSSDQLDATVMIGSNCASDTATGCSSPGSTLTLSASKTSTSEAISTNAVFSTLASGQQCSALSSTSGRLWAIVSLNGDVSLLTSQPSITISLGGAAPTTPTATTTQTADSGLLVSWSAPSDTSTIQGYQVFCSPAPSNPPAAAFETCDALTPPTGTGIFDQLDDALICSGLVGVGTNSVRVHGLQNGTTYQVAVISIGIDGSPSAPSVIAEGAPGPTLGFDDLYKEAGGTGMVGCAVAGAPGDGAGPVAFLIGLALISILARRRRRFVSPVVVVGGGGGVGVALVGFTLALLGARAARADETRDRGYVPGANPTPMGLALGDDGLPAHESPRTWNLELRFGPYYPNVDSELADRGQSARPFAQVFGSQQRLMAGLELDRQVSHRGGTWAVGFGVGFYRAKAAALGADHLTRSGDETSFRIVPLSLRAVYRADGLRTRFGSPVIPYAKLGLGCALWSVSDTAKSGSISGRTLGWNAAGGVTLDLSFLDPGGVRTMDQETGVNQFAIFFEVAHDALEGFGSSSVLRVGDTTWLGGLMLEM